jgi:hypothetical protein
MKEDKLDLEAIHSRLLDDIPVSTQWQKELVAPSTSSKERLNSHLATLYVLGRILYQLDRHKYRLEAKLAWDSDWISGCDRGLAPTEYYSITALAEKIPESTREITATFADSSDWRLICGDMWRGREFRDEVISDIYASYPPAKDSKRGRIKALDRAGFHLAADKRAIAGLTDSDKEYVSSIWNKRGGEAEASEHDRRHVLERDGWECVRCNTVPESEQIHHIIPPRQGGGSDGENLALLCMDCHLDAHEGWFANPPIYDSREEFWEWVSSYPDK